MRNMPSQSLAVSHKRSLLELRNLHGNYCARVYGIFDHQHNRTSLLIPLPATISNTNICIGS